MTWKIHNYTETHLNRTCSLPCHLYVLKIWSEAAVHQGQREANRCLRTIVGGSQAVISLDKSAQERRRTPTTTTTCPHPDTHTPYTHTLSPEPHHEFTFTFTTCLTQVSLTHTTALITGEQEDWRNNWTECISRKCSLFQQIEIA